jgi:hypothetical protein
MRGLAILIVVLLGSAATFDPLRVVVLTEPNSNDFQGLTLTAEHMILLDRETRAVGLLLVPEPPRGATVIGLDTLKRVQDIRFGVGVVLAMSEYNAGRLILDTVSEEGRFLEVLECDESAGRWLIRPSWRMRVPAGAKGCVTNAIRALPRAPDFIAFQECREGGEKTSLVRVQFILNPTGEGFSAHVLDPVPFDGEGAHYSLSAFVPISQTDFVHARKVRDDVLQYFSGDPKPRMEIRLRDLVKGGPSGEKADSSTMGSVDIVAIGEYLFVLGIRYPDWYVSMLKDLPSGRRQENKGFRKSSRLSQEWEEKITEVFDYTALSMYDIPVPAWLFILTRDLKRVAIKPLAFPLYLGSLPQTSIAGISRGDHFTIAVLQGAYLPSPLLGPLTSRPTIHLFDVSDKEILSLQSPAPGVDTH